ncbi:hypothetical protein Emag_001286 [Eimeria magna]
MTQGRDASYDGLEGEGAVKQQELQPKFDLMNINISRHEAKQNAGDLQSSLPAGEKKHPSSRVISRGEREMTFSKLSARQLILVKERGNLDERYRVMQSPNLLQVVHIQDTCDEAVDSRASKGFEHSGCLEGAEILTNDRLSTDCESSSEALMGIAETRTCDDKSQDKACFTVALSEQETIPVVGVRMAGIEGSKKETWAAAAESASPRRTNRKVAEAQTSITGQQAVSEQLVKVGKDQREQAAFFYDGGLAHEGGDYVLQIPFVVHQNQLVALPLSLYGPAVSQQPACIRSRFERQQWQPFYQSAMQQSATHYGAREQYSPTYVRRGFFTYCGSVQMPQVPPLAEPLQMRTHCVACQRGEELFHGQKRTMLPTVKAITTHPTQFFTASRRPYGQVPCLMT